MAKNGFIRNTLALPQSLSSYFQASITSQKVKVLTNDAVNYWTISLDAAADKMIATLISNTFHLFLAAANDFKNVRSLAAARTFTFAPSGNIVFAGDDGDIWSINRDGGEQRQLLPVDSLLSSGFV